MKKFIPLVFILIICLSTYAQYENKYVNDVYKDLLSIGGSFNQSNIDQTIKGLHFDIANMLNENYHNDTRIALNYQFLSSLPNLDTHNSYVNLQIAIEKGLTQPHILNDILSVYIIGENEYFGVMKIKSIFNSLTTAQAKDLYSAFNKNPFLFNHLSESEINRRLLEIKKKKNEETKIRKQLRYKDSIYNKRTEEIGVFNIKETDTVVYNRLINELMQSILYFLRNSEKNYNPLDIPDFVDILESENKKFKLKNSYIAHYKLVLPRPIDTNLNAILKSNSHDLIQETEFHSIKGNDNDCKLLKSINLKIPTIEVEEKIVLTEIEIRGLNIGYEKGITIVKITPDKVKFEDYIPEYNNFQLIIDDLIGMEEGYHLIKYEIIDIMDKKFIYTNKFYD